MKIAAVFLLSEPWPFCIGRTPAGISFRRPVIVYTAPKTERAVALANAALDRNPGAALEIRTRWEAQTFSRDGRI